MAARIDDSPTFRKASVLQAARRAWSEPPRDAGRLRTEKTLGSVHRQPGIIPAETAETIPGGGRIGRNDLRAGVDRVGPPVGDRIVRIEPVRVLAEAWA